MCTERDRAGAIGYASRMRWGFLVRWSEAGWKEDEAARAGGLGEGASRAEGSGEGFAEGLGGTGQEMELGRRWGDEPVDPVSSTCGRPRPCVGRVLNSVLVGAAAKRTKEREKAWVDA